MRLLKCSVLLLLLALAFPGLAQGPGQTNAGLPVSAAGAEGPPSEGTDWGDYHVTQTIDFGGRIADLTGSNAMYNSLVNLRSGPRILEQSLFMTSRTHTGLFDSAYVNSFGWGGDPSSAARLRITKHGWYDFTGSYRRFQNYFDFDLFANPLNPASATPGVPTITVDRSPHSFFSAHRLYDFGIVLFPQKKVSFRVGFNRNRIEGPSFSSFHEGTDVLLFQPWNNTVNTYSFGADLRFVPRTTLSYTQSLQYFKGDTDFSLAPSISFQLPGGAPVEFGLPWLNSASPCLLPLVGGSANPSCNGYFAYTRTQRVRTFIPTEQLTFQSNYFRRVDFVGTFSYGAADMNTPLNSFFDGLVTRTGQRQFSDAGSRAHARWNSVVTDAGVTIHLSDRFRILDTFRFRNFRIPGSFQLMEASLYGSAATPPTTLLSPPVTFPGDTPLHSNSSPADLENELFNRFFKQDLKENEIQLQFDFARSVGAHVGYRYSHAIDNHNWTSVALGDVFFPTLPNRGNCAGVPLNPDGSCTFTGLFDSELDDQEINSHTAIVGAWFRPNAQLRVNAEAEFGYADNFLTRIDPRHHQRVRAEATYTPEPWLAFGANLNILETRNRTEDFDFGGHTRNFGFNAVIAPNERFSFDLGYNYTGIAQNANVCFVSSVVVPGSFTCLGDPSLTEGFGNYANQTHYGNFDVMFKPVKRVTTRLGYGITDTGGGILELNPLQPLGPLSSRFQAPLAEVAVDLSKTVSAHAGWNFYQYSEGSFAGPTLPRYFHANVTTLSLRYAF